MGYPVSKNYMDQGGDRWTVGGELVITGDVVGAAPAQAYYVDTVTGDDDNSGKSWAQAFATMAAALTAVATGGTIFFRGDVREQLTGSNLKFDVTIIGTGSLHHPDVPSAGYHPGASCWRVPASNPAATTPLLTIRGRGWKLINIMFDAPADAACVRLARNSGDGLTEYDAGHASIIGCDFRNGLYGIEDYDGCFNVTVKDCVFETLDATASAAAIGHNSGGGPAAPRRWRILDNFFQNDSTTEGNERHIIIDLCGSLIKGNVFGTVKGTGKYIDLTDGSGNTVTDNTFAGEYELSNYVAGTGDVWFGNWCAIDAQTAPDGHSIAVPD